MRNFANGYTRYTNHLEQINEAALNMPEKMISDVEESYHNHLKEIAADIVNEQTNVKICMLSGPSSSGKTTTGNLLKDYIEENGKKAYIVSMDNFYLNGKDIPVLANGKKDYESVKALDIEAIQHCLERVAEGAEINIPIFSFAEQKRSNKAETIKLNSDDIVIFEGIHGLNPIFTKNVDPQKSVKLYVSVKQSIKAATGDVISPMDLRLVRRIVRDMQFRSTEPEKTLEMWDEVVYGENNYIRPYRFFADYTVNSIHIYEPCVLRTIAIPILRAIPHDSFNFTKARDLEAQLMRFEPISVDYVPKTSMLREFLGGGSIIT